jgi:hypothetical protein
LAKLQRKLDPFDTASLKFGNQSTDDLETFRAGGNRQQRLSGGVDLIKPFATEVHPSAVKPKRVPQMFAKKLRFETPLSRECLSTDAPDRLEPDGFYEPSASSRK